MDTVTYGLIGLAILGFVHIGAQGLTLKAQAGNDWSVGPRDTPPQVGPMPGRLKRALDNFTESAPIFIGLAVVSLWTGRGGALVETGVVMFIIGRLAFLPAYASGIAWLRTGCWHFASVGLLLMLAGVLIP